MYQLSEGIVSATKRKLKRLVLNFVDGSQESMHLWYMCRVTCVNTQNPLFYLFCFYLYISFCQRHVLASYEVLNSFGS